MPRTKIEILSDIENAELEIAHAVKYHDSGKQRRNEARVRVLRRELSELQTPLLPLTQAQHNAFPGGRWK